MSVVDCSTSDFSITYSFTDSANYRKDKTFVVLKQRDYLLALIFRQALYKLKPKLYELVARVFQSRSTDTNFEHWWDYLNSENGNTITLDGSLENVDPSSLLKIIARHRYFTTGRKVRSIRAAA